MAAFWSLRGHHTEGRQRLGELLGLVEDPSVARVSALNGAAWLAIDQGDYLRAADLLGESIGLSQALGDTVGEGIATVYLGRCKMSSLLIEAARPDVERAVALATEAGDRPAIAFTMFYSGLVALLTGELEAACDLFARCAAMAAGLGLAPLSARARQMLGFPLLDLGELAAARAALADGFPVCLEVGDRWVVQIGLAGFAGLAAKTGRPRLALRLAGAADAYRDANEFSMPVPILEMRRPLAGAGPGQGRAGGRAAGRGGPAAEPGGGGRASPWRTSRTTPSPPGARPALTRRETEVAALAARGLTNRDIAAQLFLSVRTVEVHVDHILTKLGFRTRTQLAAWAYEAGPAAGRYVASYVVLRMARMPRPAQSWPHERYPSRDCQVLVVGAGPTGLVLAAELLARGIRTRIIDKGDGVALQARAIGIHARTLEVLDMMGLAERFIERGQVVRQLRFYSEGRCLASLEFARCGSRFGFLLDLPQDETERLLRARVAELGGVVEPGTELTGLAPGGDAVTATVTRPGGPGPGRSPPGTSSAATARTAGSGASSAWPSTATPTRRTGCSPTSCSAATCRTGTCARTRCTRSSGRDGLPVDLLPDARAPLAADPALRRRAAASRPPPWRRSSS